MDNLIVTDKNNLKSGVLFYRFLFRETCKLLPLGR